jgi:hypothetical protein
MTAIPENPDAPPAAAGRLTERLAARCSITGPMHSPGLGAGAPRRDAGHPNTKAQRTRVVRVAWAPSGDFNDMLAVPGAFRKDCEDRRRDAAVRALGAARGASTKLPPRPMKANRNAAPLQVYDGQLLLGEIEDHGRRNVVAFKIEGTKRRIKIGIFPTRILAMRAVAGSAELDREDV